MNKKSVKFDISEKDEIIDDKKIIDDTDENCIIIAEKHLSSMKEHENSLLNCFDYSDALTNVANAYFKRASNQLNVILSISRIEQIDIAKAYASLADAMVKQADASIVVCKSFEIKNNQYEQSYYKQYTANSIINRMIKAHTLANTARINAAEAHLQIAELCKNIKNIANAKIIIADLKLIAANANVFTMEKNVIDADTKTTTARLKNPNFICQGNCSCEVTNQAHIDMLIINIEIAETIVSACKCRVAVINASNIAIIAQSNLYKAQSEMITIILDDTLFIPRIIAECIKKLMF